MKKLVVLTGPSGSGISSARFVFEELAYFIVEGAPTSTIPAILNSFKNEESKNNLFCLIVTIQNAAEVLKICQMDKEFDAQLVLLTTEKDELLKRYALTRHIHPLSMLTKLSLEEAIDKDIKDAYNVLPNADIVIETSALTTKELRRQLYARFEASNKSHQLTVTFMSFGIKNGMPMAIDMLFDVRTIPNPYWIDNLKELNGKDPQVIEYLMSFDSTKKLLEEITTYLDYHLVEVKKSDRVSYTVGICCSGGQHRSTFVAEYLAEYFSKKFKTIAVHRDSPYLNSDK